MRAALPFPRYLHALLRPEQARGGTGVASLTAKSPTQAPSQTSYGWIVDLELWIAGKGERVRAMSSNHGNNTPAWDEPTEPARYRPPSPALPPLPPPAFAPGTTPMPRRPDVYPYPPAPSRPTRSARTRRPLRYALLIGLVVILVLGALVFHRLYDFGAAISPEGPLTSQIGYTSGSTRINVLVLGYGGGTHPGADLTDSLMVMSLAPGDHATTLISVPRDLWVQVPPNSGQYEKINTAYQDGLDNGFGGAPAGRIAGGNEAANKVSDVLGIPVNYWLTIDFTGFRDLVDALGGVDITVPTAFTAQYPANDDPTVNPAWKTISFTTGPQHMDGERAIEYARARYVTAPLSEGSDFARSARQQLLLRAILARARSISAWPGLTGALDALQRSIYTNLSLADLFFFMQKLNFTKAAHLGLSNQNVLVDATSSDGQDILLPQNGDWAVIRQYVAAGLAS